MNVFFIQAETGLPILDMEIGYSQARVNEILGGYGPVGFARYRLIMFADVFHPAVYGTLMATFIWALMRNRAGLLLSLLPVFTALLDWAENFYIWRMMSAPLPVATDVWQVAQVLSYAKHGMLAVSVGVLVILILRRLLRMLLA